MNEETSKTKSKKLWLLPGENNFFAEKLLVIVAYLILLFGILLAAAAIFDCVFDTDDLDIDGWGVPIIILLITLSVWASMLVLANISVILKRHLK